MSMHVLLQPDDDVLAGNLADALDRLGLWAMAGVGGAVTISLTAQSARALLGLVEREWERLNGRKHD